MSETFQGVRVMEHEVESEPVLCAEQLAYLAYKSGQLSGILQAESAPSREFALGRDTVTFESADDGSSRIVQHAVAERNHKVTYTIEPDKAFSYEVHDDAGTLLESWSCPADAQLSEDEAALMSPPLYMLMQCLSQAESAGQTEA